MRTLIIAVLALSCTRPVPPANVSPNPPANAPGPSDAASYGPVVADAYAKVRAATERFHNIEVAVTAGYPAQVAQCLDSLPVGTMGYHHVNRQLLSTTLEIERPQILLYERLDDGKLALTAVEYIVPFRMWPSDSVPPVIMGRKLVQNPALQLWYLHMWAWKPNPTGLFADWNPAVRCRSE